MLDPHGALIYTMVIVSAADSDMTDAELAIIGDIVGHLPVFRDFDRKHLPSVLEDCSQLLSREDGLEEAFADDQGGPAGQICARPPMRSPATSPPPTAKRARRSCGCSK